MEINGQNNITAEKMPRSNEYWAKLSEYEGPLDILLHFVKEDELNIYDIPISKITNDFLEYINYMTSLDIELAGEFLLMAAELMKIKARMLIPQTAEEESEEEDPRITLIRKLLEYKRFKDAAAELTNFEENARNRFQRLYFRKDEKIHDTDIIEEFGLQNLNIYNLIKGYKIVITSMRREIVHPIELLSTTPEIQREFLINFFSLRTTADFKDIINEMDDKLLVICTFLSILQLALEGYLKIVKNSTDHSDFSIVKELNEHLN